MSTLRDANQSAIQGFVATFNAHATEIENARKKLLAATMNVGSRWKDPDYVMVSQLINDICLLLSKVDNLNKSMCDFLRLKLELVKAQVSGQ